jgi:glycerophosphoryl diester phosphodiesterase
MAAFRRALELGADAIELDVHATADGHLVVMHDPSVDRTTDGKGELRKLRHTEIRTLDAGRWYGMKFAGERVPLLEEVLEFAHGRLLVDVELKVEGVEMEAVTIVRKTGMTDATLFTSFLPAPLEQCRSLAGEIPIGFLHEAKAVDRARAIGAQVYLPAIDALTGDLAEECRRAALRVIPWTVRTADQARAALKVGVHGIIANDPVLVREVLAERRP